MKKSFKKLAILFLVFAITVVSFPVIQFASKAADTNASTYTFNFDGEDDYDFYESDYTGLFGGPAFKNYAEGVVSPVASTFSEIKISNASQAGVYNNGTWIFGEDSGNNKVGMITTPAATGETARVTGHLGDFVSPDAKVFTTTAAKGQYLTSGSFVVNMSRFGSYTPVLVFGQNDTTNYLFRIGCASTYEKDYLYHNELALGRDVFIAKSDKTHGLLKASAVIRDEAWVKYDFVYGVDGKLTLTVKDSANNTGSFTSASAIAPEDRAFALTTAASTGPDNANRPIYFDNVVLNFSGEVESDTDTVNFVFDGDDEYSFVNNAYDDKYLHNNVSLTSQSYTHTVTDGVLKLANARAKEGMTPALSNLGEFISPDPALFTAEKALGKGLTSGTFSYYVTADSRDRGNQAYIFGMDDEYYYIVFFTKYNSQQCATFFKQLRTEEFANSANIHSNPTVTTSGRSWMKFGFYYNADGQFVLQVYDPADLTLDPKEVTYTGATFTYDQRMIAFTDGYSTNTSTDRQTQIDNVTLNFTPIPPEPKVETVDFTFEGSDTYKFYKSSDTTENPAFPNGSLTSATFSLSNAAVQGNNLAAITTPTGNAATISNPQDDSTDSLTAAFGDLPDLVSPDKALFDTMTASQKYLTSGSFDLSIGRTYNFYQPVLLFGQNETTNYVLRFGLYNSNFKVKETSYQPNESVVPSIPTPHKETPLFVASGSSERFWFHFDFSYDNAGYFSLTVTDGVKTETFISKNAIPYNERAFAITSIFCNASKGRIIQFDNVSLDFVSSDDRTTVSNYRNLQYVKETLELDAAKITPYDIERINNVYNGNASLNIPALADMEEYYEIDNFSQDISKIKALKAAADTWINYEVPSKVALQFYKKYFKVDTPDYTLAYNVYRRLGKEARAAFDTTYMDKKTAMLDAVKGAADEDGLVISVVGDLNTVNADSITGATATATNYGDSTSAILSAAALEDAANRNGGYRATAKYDDSIAATDIVLVSLGYNDLLNDALFDTTGAFNIGRKEQLKAVYTDLVQSYMSMACNPQVILTTPVSESIDATRAATFRALLKEIATEYDLPLFDAEDVSKIPAFADFTITDTESACILEHTHTGGTATCSALAECDLCNQDHGTLKPDNHSFTGEIDDNGEKHGNKCIWCGEIGNFADHTYDGTYEKTDADENNHYDICTVCGHKETTGVAHTFGDTFDESAATTEKHFRICDVCGFTDKTGEAHTPNIETDDIYTEVFCTVCNHMISGNTYYNDFENGAEDAFVVEEAWNVHTHNDSTDKVFTTKDYHTGGGFCSWIPAPSAQANTVGVIARPKSYDDTVFASPKKEVFDNFAAQGKYLSSGSFDIALGRAGIYTNLFCLGYLDNDGDGKMSAGDSAINIYAGNCRTASNYTYWHVVEQSLDDTLTKLGEASNATLPIEYAPDARWMHVEFFYEGVTNAETGETTYSLKLVVSDDTGISSVITFDKNILPEDRLFAFASIYESDVLNEGHRQYFDNVVLMFTEAGATNTDALNFYKNNNKKFDHTFDYSIDTVVPFDANSVVFEIYDPIKNNINVKHNAPYVNKITALQTAIARWDTTTYKTLAKSFIDIYGDKLTEPTTYGVFNRLSKKARAYIKKYYADEYKQMFNAVSGAEEDTTINVTFFGDNQLGSFASTLENNLTAINSSYAVNNYSCGTNNNRLHLVTNAAEGLNLRYGNFAANYANSLNADSDIVILSVGSAQLIRDGFDLTDETKRNAYKEAYTEMVNDYLRLPSNPTIVLASPTIMAKTPGSQTLSDAFTNDLSHYNSYIPILIDIQKEIADEYGLQIIDLQTYTSQRWDSGDLNNTYFTDSLDLRWTLTTTAVSELAQLAASYISAGQKVVNTAAASVFDFNNSDTISPQLTGATLKNEDMVESENGTKRKLYFNYTLPDLPEGVTIVEHGIIATYSQYIMDRFDVVTENEDLSLLNAAYSLAEGETKPSYYNYYVIKAENTDNANTIQSDGVTYYHSYINLSTAYYGVRVTARAYIVLSDGRVYYSCNDKADQLGQTSADGTIGVVDGFAVRSIVGITMNIARFVAAQDAEDKLTETVDETFKTMTDFVVIGDLNSIESWTVGYYNQMISDGTNGDLFVRFIAANQKFINDIFNPDDGSDDNEMPDTSEGDDGFVGKGDEGGWI